MQLFLIKTHEKHVSCTVILWTIRIRENTVPIFLSIHPFTLIKSSIGKPIDISHAHQHLQLNRTLLTKQNCTKDKRQMHCLIYMEARVWRAPSLMIANDIFKIFKILTDWFHVNKGVHQGCVYFWGTYLLTLSYGSTGRFWWRVKVSKKRQVTRDMQMTWQSANSNKLMNNIRLLAVCRKYGFLIHAQKKQKYWLLRKAQGCAPGLCMKVGGKDV